jgi:hypothetical protein
MPRSLALCLGVGLLSLDVANAFFSTSARRTARSTVEMKSKNPPTYTKKKAMGKTGFKVTKWAEGIEGGWLVDGKMEDEQVAPPAQPSAKPGSVAASSDNMQLCVRFVHCGFSLARRAPPSARGGSPLAGGKPGSRPEFSLALRSLA